MAKRLRHADIIATQSTALGGDGKVTRTGPLRQRFIVPPFNLLDARQGEWQSRKRAWLGLGIQSELGRGADGKVAATSGAVGHDGNHFPGANMTPGDPATDSRPKRRALNGGASEAAPNDRYGPRPSSTGRNTRPGRSGDEDYKGGDAWLGSGNKARYAGNGQMSTPFNDADAMQGMRAKYAKAEAFDESGRSTPSGPSQLRDEYAKGDAKANGLINEIYGRDDEAGGTQSQTGTSIFDPVLCELMYRWFCPPKGVVIDPFAGGSVRGIVAANLGLGYVGIELRSEQTAANLVQKSEIIPESRLTWITGDARDVKQHVKSAKFDYIFSCPPYYNLELYSYDPKDLSNAPTYEDFLVGYGEIIADTVSTLKNNRFACFVVGNMRGKDGYYYDFVGDTIRAFESAGASLYNEAILVTAVGSLPLRLNNQFLSNLKLGRTYQNCLVFCKGDWRKAVEAAKGENWIKD